MPTKKTNDEFDLKVVSMPEFALPYDALQKQLEKELAKYDVIVTPETLADSKSMATELNKRAAHINRVRIDKVREVSAPIKDVDGKLKALADRTLEVRQKILDQVEVFNAKQLEIADQRLTDFRAELRAELGVDAEFYKAEFDDLIKQSSLTAKGALAKPARVELERRVRDELAMQERVGIRLQTLENRCRSVGLKAPLVRENVAAFLYKSEADYETALTRMLEVELQRQQRAEDEAQEADQMDAGENPAPGQHVAEKTPEPPAEVQPGAMEPAPEGKNGWVVRVEFHTHTPLHITAVQIQDKLREGLEDAGFSPQKIVASRA